MNINYRSVLIKDALEIGGLLKELGYGTEEQQLIGRLKNIHSRGGEVFVAEDNNKVIGCVHIFVDLRLAEGEAAEIATLVVSDKYRGCGIGQKLLANAQAWAEQQGLKVLKVRSNLIRERAHQFYFDQGFEELKNQKVFAVKLK